MQQEQKAEKATEGGTNAESLTSHGGVEQENEKLRQEIEKLREENKQLRETPRSFKENVELEAEDIKLQPAKSAGETATETPARQLPGSPQGKEGCGTCCVVL